MDGRTAPRTAAMDTFRLGSGGDVVRRMGTQQQQQCHSVSCLTSVNTSSQPIKSLQLFVTTFLFCLIWCCERYVVVNRDQDSIKLALFVC